MVDVSSGSGFFFKRIPASGTQNTKKNTTNQLVSVLRIRIHTFFGLPDPDPLVVGWIRIMLQIRILLSSCKNSRNNLDSFYLVILFDFLFLKKDVNVGSKSNKQNKLLKISFSLPS
jgi:hypothetical protein